MENLVKVGNKYPKGHPNHFIGYRDGQLIDRRPSGYYKARRIRKGFCVIEDGRDYWKIRGSDIWKSTAFKVMEMKKFLCAVDSGGRYKWELNAKQDEKRIRSRDWFVDFKYLLNMGWINQATFESIYDRDKDHNPVFIDRTLDQWLFREDVKKRLVSPYSDNLASVSAGTFSIGAGVGPDYPDVTAAEADTAAILTNNLTFEHLDEETSITTIVTFDVDTATHLLKLTAASGAEHNGGAYGNGARILFGTFDRITFNEASGGTLDNIRISKLAIDASGSGNYGVYFANGGDGGNWLANRLLIKGDSGTSYGIRCDGTATNVDMFNNIIYGVADVSAGRGIFLRGGTSGVTYNILNNTVIKCRENIRQHDGTLNATMVMKNNLCQGGTTADFADGGGGFGTTAKNISEDATSPNASYRSKDLHTNTIFNDYAGDDYRLNSGGDATNLAIADDGENLFGDGVVEDNAGQARDNELPFWIGASHIPAVGGADIRKQITQAYMRINN